MCKISNLSKKEIIQKINSLTSIKDELYIQDNKIDEFQKDKEGLNTWLYSKENILEKKKLLFSYELLSSELHNLKFLQNTLEKPFKLRYDENLIDYLNESIQIDELIRNDFMKFYNNEFNSLKKRIIDDKKGEL